MGVHPRCAIPVAAALRHALIELAGARNAQLGQQTTMELVCLRAKGADIAKSTRSLPTAFSDREVPNQPIIATEIAASRTREPITVMIPLLWLPVNNGQVLSIQNSPVPASPVVRDMPLTPQLRIGDVRCWSNCGKHLLFQSIRILTQLGGGVCVAVVETMQWDKIHHKKSALQPSKSVLI
jgi:hypothetical protein